MAYELERAVQAELERRARADKLPSGAETYLASARKGYKSGLAAAVCRQAQAGG